jgi:hypothetical protein
MGMLAELDQETLEAIAASLATGVVAVATKIWAPIRWRVFWKTIRRLCGTGHPPTPGNAEVGKDKEVYRLLVELRLQFDADRASIVRFHNGSHFAPDRRNAIWRLTRTHEIVLPGVSREARACQGTLFSHLTELVGPTVTGEPETGTQIVCHDCQRCQGARLRHCVMIQTQQLLESSTKNLLQDMGVHTTLTTNLHDQGRVFGMVMLEWCDQPHGDPTDENQHRRLCEAAERLQHLLQGD